MLSPREYAAVTYQSACNMSWHVMGFSSFETDQLRLRRIEAFTLASRALRGACGTPRIVASEWPDEELLIGAEKVEHQLALEVRQREEALRRASQYGPRTPEPTNQFRRNQNVPPADPVDAA